MHTTKACVIMLCTLIYKAILTSIAHTISVQCTLCVNDGQHKFPFSIQKCDNTHITPVRSSLKSSNLHSPTICFNHYYWQVQCFTVLLSYNILVSNTIVWYLVFGENRTACMMTKLYKQKVSTIF